jgi:lysozyme
MTLYGIDISNYQANINLDQVAKEGFSWVEAKVSEGNSYKDPTWATNQSAAAKANLPIIGYHFAIAADDPASQVQTWQANGGPNVCMIDFETNSGNIDNYWALVNAFNAAGIKVALSYIPQWYWNKIGSPDLSKVPGLVSSAYPGGNGYASTLYENGGGDSGEGWASYGGGTPVIWQFTDRAAVAGMTVDADAFRGSASDLAALLSGS